MMNITELDRELIVRLVGDRLQSEVWQKLGDDWNYFQTDLWPRLLRKEPIRGKNPFPTHATEKLQD